jgi:hypothetical protein
VVVKLRERLAVNKQRSRRFDMERFNLKKLDKVEGKEQFHTEVWKIWMQRWKLIAPEKLLERRMLKMISSKET